MDCGRCCRSKSPAPSAAPPAARARRAPSAVRDRVDFLLGSITDVAMVRRAVAGVDFVLHQAARTSVVQSVEDPLSTHDVNVNGTLNLLLAARDARVRRVVLAASTAAYG